MKKKKAASEFGEGLVQQLVLFANHFGNEMADDIQAIACFASKLKTHSLKDCNATISLRSWAKMQIMMVFEENPKLFRDLDKRLSRTKKKRLLLAKKLEDRIPSMIHLWANGASDHLSGLHCLPTVKGINRSPLVTKMDEKIYQLVRWGLKMGHGFSPDHEKFCTMKRFERLKSLTKEIARLLDQHLGVKSDPGSWQ